MTKGHKITREETVSAKIIDLISDLRLDLDMVGLYFGRYARLAMYLRLEHIYHTAKHHRENKDDHKAHYESIKNINA